MIRGTLRNVQRICLHTIYAIYDELSRSIANRLSTLTLSKTAIWNTSQIGFPQQSSLVKDNRLLLMISNNIYASLSEVMELNFYSNALRKSWWGSCFVQQTHTNIVLTHFGTRETNLQW